MYPSEKHSQALKCKIGHHKHTTYYHVLYSSILKVHSQMSITFTAFSYLLLSPMSNDRYGPLLKGKEDIQITHSRYISKFAYWLQLSALASFEKPQPKLTINLSWRRNLGNKNLRELDVHAASKCCVSDHRA